MQKSDLNALQNAEITKCDPSRLIELRSVKIDRGKSVSERMVDYLNAVGNPYLFRVGDVAVKVCFNPAGKPFSDALADSLAS